MIALLFALFIAEPPQAPPLAGAPSQAPPVREIVIPAVWQDNYTAAMVERGRTGKPLLIDFRTSPCVWCDKLEASPLKDVAVQSILRRFVLVKLDGQEHESLLDGFRKVGYEVKGYPTLLVIAGDAQGSVVSMRSGYQSASALKTFLLAAEAWSTNLRNGAAVTVPHSAPKTSRVHSHRCPLDGTVWWHSDASFGRASDHRCPACGQLVWQVYSSKGSFQ